MSESLMVKASNVEVGAVIEKLRKACVLD